MTLETQSRIRRALPTATICTALGVVVVLGISTNGEETASYPQQPEYSCADNPRGYVLRQIGEQSVTAVLGVRSDDEDRQPSMDNLVTVTGDKRAVTVMLPGGSRVIYPELLEQGKSVELSDPTNASVRMAYVDGEPAIGIACSSDAWDGTVFDENTDFAPLQQVNN